MNPETLRHAILAGPQDASWGNALLAHADAWQARETEYQEAVDELNRRVKDAMQRGDRIRALEARETELIEALKGLVAVLDLQADELSDAVIAYVPENEAARAAIKKAEGG